MMNISINRKSREVLTNFNKIPKNLPGGLFLALADIGNEFVKEEINLQKRRDKTGRLYNGIRASAPGEVPQMRTGRLAKSTAYKAHSPLYMTFGQTVDYAKFLADGVRGRMGPRGNLTNAVHNKVGQAASIIMQHVNESCDL